MYTSQKTRNDVITILDYLKHEKLQNNELEKCTIVKMEVDNCTGNCKNCRNCKQSHNLTMLNLIIDRINGKL